MNIRTLTAISVIMVAGAAAGCSDETEYGDETATTMEPEMQQESPATTPQDPMAAQRTPADQQPYSSQSDPQMAGQSDDMQTGDTMGEEATGPDASEFASFDTDSDGELAEDEWKDAEDTVKNLRNMSFAQIDRDSSGAIDLQEFRRAKTQNDSAVPTGTDSQNLDPTAP